uniref:Amine oxidase domain-containing protein n=1 Tax=Phytophthora ramorum TaxID=164328 RepID=H3GHR9_PHYRM
MSANVYRVVVVGAGMAGVATAKALLASDHFSAEDICVLEAQHRIGGRIHTRPFSDELPVKVEAGAAWIHGTQGNPMAELVREFGIELKEISARNPWLHPSSCPGFVIYEGSRQLTEHEVNETWEWQDSLLRKLQELALSGKVEGKALDGTVEQLLTEDAELREILASNTNARKRLALCLHLVETWMGNSSDEMQIDAFGEIDLMGFTADRVVVTCSLGFLKSGKLHFQPELPLAKADVISRSQMGQCMKIMVQFPKAFWPKNASFITQINNTPEFKDNETPRIYFPVIFSYYATKGVPILEGDLVGDKARAISDALSDDEIAHALFLQLQDTFGAEIPKPVDHFITRWDQDEWAQGAYSSVTVASTYEDPDMLRHSVANRIFFAGEATNYEYQGALQAAYLSGHQAADEIIRAEASCTS